MKKKKKNIPWSLTLMSFVCPKCKQTTTRNAQTAAKGFSSGKDRDHGDRTGICICTDIAISAYYFCILKILCILY